MNITNWANSLRRAVRMRFRGSAKSLRKEHIADLFLKHLSRKDVDGPDAILLNFLDDENIYYDAESLAAVMTLLLEKKLIKEVSGTMAAVGYFDDSNTTVTEGIVSPANWLSSIEGIIKQSAITSKGRDFIKKGQRLDAVGIAESKALRDKWLDKIITFFVTVITAVVVTWFTEPVKQWWSDKKTNTTTRKY